MLHDPSTPAIHDASPRDPRDGSRLCAWCANPIPEFSASGRRRRVDSKTCSKRCRQNRHRWQVERTALAAAAKPMSFAFADPPYPGRAHLYPENSEVDHAALIDRLTREFPNGWALSTAADALRDVLALCPSEVRVASWHRRSRPTSSKRALSAWEPVILSGGRQLALGESQTLTDALTDQSRHHAFPGAMIGMKTPAFAEWIFRQLGARPNDQLTDLYPGSGAIQKAWAFFIGDPDA